jgi:hypothetical protein
MGTFGRFIGLLAASATALVAGCGGENGPAGPSPTPGPFAVVGRVISFTSGAALPGATVSYEPEAGGAATVATADATGTYTLSIPTTGTFVVRVGGALAGTVIVGPTPFRGDLLIDQTTCRTRYGEVVDARTLRPVAGATVALPGATTTTDASGWYRLDLGCDPSPSFSTTFIDVRHPSYADFTQVVGRGVSAVLRLDVALTSR